MLSARVTIAPTLSMKLLFDLFPLLIFFAAFKIYDIYVATAAAIIATFLQVGIHWARTRRFETMHLVTLAIITVFGGLTILLKDDVFIKWKPTIVNWIFTALILGASLITKRPTLKRLMGNQVQLPDAVWKKMDISWSLFFLVVGFLNLYVAFYYNPGADEAVRTATWVNFKVFGLMGLTLAFMFVQVFFISKHIEPEEES